MIFDESSFWRDEVSANPDVEVYRACMPSLVRTGGTLTAISTPYRRAGLLFNKHKNFFGIVDDQVLVVQGDSRTFNPTLSEKAIVQAMADDPEAGLSEWQGEFRADVDSFLSDADIDSCVNYDRPLELPPRPNVSYFAFVDASGGRGDAMTLAIGHKEGERIINDVVRGRAAPFNPQDVVAEYAALLKDYRCFNVRGDYYAAEWVATAFKDHGIKYDKAALPKGRLYVECLPLFTRGLLSLPNHPRLLRELRLLERRIHVGARESVDHPRGDHDDHANALAGCAYYVRQKKRDLRMFHGEADGFGRLTEIDPRSGRPLDHGRSYSYRAADGTLRLRSDNTGRSTRN